MKQIKGLPRHQVTFGSHEDSVSAENLVRILNAFMDKLDLNQLAKINNWNPNYREIVRYIIFCLILIDLLQLKSNYNPHYCK